MAFGIQVRTSRGMVDLAESQSCRLIEIIQATSVTGSVTIPGFDASDANFFVVNDTDRWYIPSLDWNNATKVLSWTWRTTNNANPVSDNFTIYAFEV